MSERTRNAWQKPELIVLLRGSPEEAVLLSRKFQPGAGGSANQNTGCNTKFLFCSKGQVQGTS
jgi:hypothetical protein